MKILLLLALIIVAPASNIWQEKNIIKIPVLTICAIVIWWAVIT